MRSSTFLNGTLALLAAVTLLSGCSTSFAPAPEVPTQTSFGPIQGVSYGGRQPIVGAHIYAYAAGTTTYGGTSTSLLGTASVTGYTTAPDVNGNYYVTTDSNGAWKISAATTCTSGTQVYLYSTGGDAGSGANAAASLMAVLGQCPTDGELAQSIGTNTRVIINEAATISAAYATSGFATDPLHISAPVATSNQAKVGLANAFATAANLYSLTNGASGASSVTPYGNGNVPQALLNSLANVLASCINTSGATSPACSQLFENATSNGTATGTAPTDTATAAIYIAHNPYSANVANIFNVAGTSSSSPFQPQLSSAPSNFTVELSFTGGGIQPAPGGDLVALSLAVDAAGNIWSSNYSTSTLTELSPLGVPANASGFTGNSLNGPRSIAVDSSGDIWVANLGNNSISVFNSTGGTAVGPFTTSINAPQSVAFDGSGHAWIGSSNANIVELSSTGAVLNGSVTGNQLSQPYILALAQGTAGNVWVADFDADYAPVFMNNGTVAPNSPYAGMDEPNCVALDASGNAWFADDANGATEITTAGTVVHHTAGVYLYGCAIDGASNIWVSDYSGAQVVELNNSGTVISGPSSGGYAQNINPDSIMIDGSGNVWFNTFNDNTLRELVGAATPVSFPLSHAVANNKLGQRP